MVFYIFSYTLKKISAIIVIIGNGMVIRITHKIKDKEWGQKI